MNKQTIASGPNPKVTLVVDGDLTLKGWDDPEILAKSSSVEELRIEQRDEDVHIHCFRDCLVRVPYEAQVEIERVSGHALIRSLEGELKIAQLDGNLTLRNVGPAVIGRVHGSMTAKNVSGDLTIQRVDGNISLRDVDGDFRVEDIINGNLSLKGTDGDVKATARGNVSATLDPSPGNRYDLAAYGNLSCRIPDDASAHISILKGNRLKIHIPDIQSASGLQTPYELAMGDGDAEIVLSARGNVMLSASPPDWELGDLEVEIGEDFAGMSESLSEQISRQVEAQMEFLEQQLESQLENLSSRLSVAGLTAEQAERISWRTHGDMERARSRAEEQLRRAQEKMGRKLEAVRQRAERKARAAERAARDRRRRPEPVEPASPAPRVATEPVSEEERLMILRMLEQGKITPAEADELLSAMEGEVS